MKVGNEKKEKLTWVIANKFVRGPIALLMLPTAVGGETAFSTAFNVAHRNPTQIARNTERSVRWRGLERNTICGCTAFSSVFS